MSVKEMLEKKIKEVCTLYGNFTLRSGIKTNVYFDKYLLEADPYILEEICIELSKQWIFPDKEFDYIAGLETGGIPLAVMLSHITKIPTLFVRKKAKEYGTCKLAEGTISIKEKKLLVVEDVVTTGGQVINSCLDLENEGAIIKEVCCVILRDKKGQEVIQRAYKFSTLFDFSKET